jgi:probable phosphoglycerate mutase
VALAAARLRGEEEFDLVVSSDLLRARSTAELMSAHLGLSVPHLVEPALREYDVGEWSGYTRDEIEQRWPGALSEFDGGALAAPPGGEDRHAFDERVRQAAVMVAEWASALGALRVLVVAHGGLIRSLARSSGLPDRRTGPLGGYRGTWEEGFLCPIEPVDLLDKVPPAFPDTPAGQILSPTGQPLNPAVEPLIL